MLGRLDAGTTQVEAASSRSEPFQAIKDDRPVISSRSEQTKPSARAEGREMGSIFDGTAVNLAAGVIDVTAQLAALFKTHLLALLTLGGIKALVTLPALRPFSVEIILRAVGATLTTLFTRRTIIPLRSRMAGTGNTCTKQKKMR